jgi:hypothetical protein
MCTERSLKKLEKKVTVSEAAPANLQVDSLYVS